MSASSQSLRFILSLRCVRKQPIIALYFESENELKLYNLEARAKTLTSDLATPECSNILETFIVNKYVSVIELFSMFMSASLKHLFLETATSGHVTI